MFKPGHVRARRLGELRAINVVDARVLEGEAPRRQNGGRPWARRGACDVVAWLPTSRSFEDCRVLTSGENNDGVCRVTYEGGGPEFVSRRAGRAGPATARHFLRFEGQRQAISSPRATKAAGGTTGGARHRAPRRRTRAREVEVGATTQRHESECRALVGGEAGDGTAPAAGGRCASRSLFGSSLETRARAT